MKLLCAFTIFLFSQILFLNPQAQALLPSDIEIKDLSGTVVCTGQIISPNYFVVEAQNLVGLTTNNLYAVAGNSTASEQQISNIVTISIHPNFNPTTLDFNVAVVEISTPLAIAEYVTLASAEDSRFKAYITWICQTSGVCNSANGVCQLGEAVANIFPNGLAYDTTTQDVCLDNLGYFDSTSGALNYSNYDSTRSAYVLDGKYLRTSIQSLTPTIDPASSTINDFRVTPAGDLATSAREATLKSSQAHLYYYVNNYRKQYINDTFVASLGLSSTAAANIQTMQYNPNLAGIVNARLPWFYANELTSVAQSTANAAQNDFFSSSKQRSTTSDPLDSLAFDPDYVISLYTGVVSNWITTGTAQWPSDPTWGNVGNTSWQTDIRPAILEGFKAWNAYRATGHTEINKYAMTVLRRWSGYTCGTVSTPACDKGWNIDNAMMYLDNANPAVNNPSNPGWPVSSSDDTLLFPFIVRSGVGTNHFGPQNGSLGGLFIAAIFYDISKEIGLGDYKADQLFWKVISSIDPGNPINMTNFGISIQQAARSLWPTTDDPNASWYEQDLVDLLSSRGIRVNGVTNFINNIPAQIGTTANPGPGTLVTASTSGVGSSIPESQRNSTTGYNFLNYFFNTYNVTTLGTQYVTYQFYKYSRYAACDALDLTNGTINNVSTANPIMNYDGSMSVSYKNKSMANMLLLVPGNSLTFMRRRQSCVSEKDGYYTEDIRPTGFRVLKAIPNGFTVSVQKTGTSNGRNNYILDIIDPSITLTGPNTGPASYTWTFTEFNGTTVVESGEQVSYSALLDQPFTISIDRVRGTDTDNLTLRERGNDFDRNNGKQFNQDYWNAGYPVGFDTIINRRMVEGHGSYNSALNPVGAAFGVQAHSWTTPNQLVKPLRFSAVSHGLGSGSNLGGAYQFQNANYYNACIWGARANVTNYPGCHTDTILDDSEMQIPFAQTGIDLANPFAIVTASALPAHLWTVQYPDTWRLQANTEYHFAGHISASVVNNGYSYNVCSLTQAAGVAGQPSDRSDWLAGANWSGSLGAPPPQTMRQYLTDAASVPNCTFAAYKFEGETVAP